MERRRLILLIVALLIVSASGTAELKWKQDTQGQKLLKTYIENVNDLLLSEGEQPVNSLFEMYRGFAVLGITREDNAETPEGVEITVNLYQETINSLELRVSDTSRFAVVAAAFICGMSPDTMSVKDCIKDAAALAERAVREPDNSYRETVEELNGTLPRIYYSYLPDEYQDGVNWLQMTIIFPLEGYWDGTSIGGSSKETNAPDTYSENSEGYEGYYSEDDYQHYEVFVTATPEPDSAAAEYDPYGK